MTPDSTMKVKAIDWQKGQLGLLDQRLLPNQEVWIKCSRVDEVLMAFRDQVIDGSAGIAITAAYGVALAARQRFAENPRNWLAPLEEDLNSLQATHPELPQLAWVLQQMQRQMLSLCSEEDPFISLASLAETIHQADFEAGRLMAQLGAEILATHQDHGRDLMLLGDLDALTAGRYGTALGVARQAWEQGFIDQVHLNETRPGLQASQRTAWALEKEGVPYLLHADTAAGLQLKNAPISWILVGAECITAQGDLVNRIGTYQLAILALHHGAGLMVVAPSSCIDLSVDYGEDLPVPTAEVAGQFIDPLVDITPADLVDYLVTEKGVVHRPDKQKLEKLLSRKSMH